MVERALGGGAGDNVGVAVAVPFDHAQVSQIAKETTERVSPRWSRPNRRLRRHFGEARLTSPAGSRGDGGPDLFAETLEAIATTLEQDLLTGLGSLSAAREKHLKKAVKTVLEEHLGLPVKQIVVPLDDWPSLGRSTTDIVVEDPPGSRRPRHVAELKWCLHGREDKVHEAIWDLFKMALMSRKAEVRSAHLITGVARAPVDRWSDALCRDIFDGGCSGPRRFASVRFPTGGQSGIGCWKVATLVAAVGADDA